MMSFENLLKQWSKSEKLMPGGVNSPVRAFKSVDTPAIFGIMVKGLKYMILMEMNTLIMC